VERAEGNGGRGHAAEWDFPRSKPPGFSMRCQKRRRAPVPFREHCGNNLAATSLLAGRRTCTREEFCVAVSFIIAGVLLPRPAHTKTICVAFRETQRLRVQIPLSWNSFIQFGYSFFARAKKLEQRGGLFARRFRRSLAGFRTTCNNRGPSSPHRGECHSPFWALPSPIRWERAQG